MSEPDQSGSDLDSYSGAAMQQRRAKAVRTAIFMALVALGVFVAFIWSNIK